MRLFPTSSIRSFLFAASSGGSDCSWLWFSRSSSRALHPLRRSGNCLIQHITAPCYLNLLLPRVPQEQAAAAAARAGNHRICCTPGL